MSLQVKDLCGCDECAKVAGEECGNWNWIEGTCGAGLVCVKADHGNFGHCVVGEDREITMFFVHFTSNIYLVCVSVCLFAFSEATKRARLIKFWR